jgi:hypothetical protein
MNRLEPLGKMIDLLIQKCDILLSEIDKSITFIYEKHYQLKNELKYCDLLLSQLELIEQLNEKKLIILKLQSDINSIKENIINYIQEL